MKIITSNIRAMAKDLYRVSDKDFWEHRLKDTYGLDLDVGSGVHDIFWLLRQTCSIFEPVSPKLVKACGVVKLIFKNDMGPNRTYYPNHGFYRPSDKTVTLNADIFYHPDQPDDFFDHRGYFLTRPQQTILHEFGHGFDAYHDDLCLKPDWMKLSGWSETCKPGLQQLRIKEKGVPEIIGEYYYDPSAGFTRFYAKRNPWDDWADSFSFYIAGLRDKVPANKTAYFDKLLKEY